MLWYCDLYAIRAPGAGPEQAFETYMLEILPYTTDTCGPIAPARCLLDAPLELARSALTGYIEPWAA